MADPIVAGFGALQAPQAKLCTYLAGCRMVRALPTLSIGPAWHLPPIAGVCANTGGNFRGDL
ncbi:MAG: hypothetical protein M3Y43_11505 [Pseudomonadota bacterium]|nr:hypothetical protein [Pseudomonadota bacterium]MDQ2705786.1 hypothetical protein [Pseudomonadota bacterium]